MLSYSHSTRFLRHTDMSMTNPTILQMQIFCLYYRLLLCIYSQSLSRITTRVTRDYECCRLIWDAPVTQVCARLKWNRKPDVHQIDRWRRKEKDNSKGKRRKYLDNSLDFQVNCIRVRWTYWHTSSHERSRELTPWRIGRERKKEREAP